MKTLNDGFLDPNTFGSEKACVVLAEFLSQPDNAHHTRKIGMNLNRFSTVATELKNSNVPIEHKKMLLSLYFNNCKEFFKNVSMPNKLMSYAQNVLNARYNKIRREIQ